MRLRRDRIVWARMPSQMSQNITKELVRWVGLAMSDTLTPVSVPADADQLLYLLETLMPAKGSS